MKTSSRYHFGNIVLFRRNFVDEVQGKALYQNLDRADLDDSLSRILDAKRRYVGEARGLTEVEGGDVPPRD